MQVIASIIDQQLLEGGRLYLIFLRCCRCERAARRRRQSFKSATAATLMLEQTLLLPRSHTLYLVLLRRRLDTVAVISGLAGVAAVHPAPPPQRAVPPRGGRCHGTAGGRVASAVPTVLVLRGGGWSGGRAGGLGGWIACGCGVCRVCSVVCFVVRIHAGALGHTCRWQLLLSAEAVNHMCSICQQHVSWRTRHCLSVSKKSHRPKSS